jgi:hypothetical protein
LDDEDERKDDEQKMRPKPKPKKKWQPVKEEPPQRVEPELIEEEELAVVPVRFEIDERKFTPKSWSPCGLFSERFQGLFNRTSVRFGPF